MKAIKNLIFLVSILFMVWIVASFINVNLHNLTDQNFATWNLFTMFTNCLQ